MFLGAVALLGDAPGLLSQTFYHKEVIAACLILEAGGEGQRGMQAVMNVIQNRAHGDPEDFYAQTVAPHQFAVFDSARGFFFREFAPVIRKARKSPAWSVAKGLVERAYRNELPDITGGATHFASSRKPKPDWARDLRQTVVIGGHRFMK